MRAVFQDESDFPLQIKNMSNFNLEISLFYISSLYFSLDFLI